MAQGVELPQSLDLTVFQDQDGLLDPITPKKKASVELFVWGRGGDV